MPVDRGPLLIDGLQAESQMPFSSLRDPIDVSRSRGGLELAWSRIRFLLAREDREREHARLAFIVVTLAPVSIDEDDLAERAWKRYWQR